MNRAVIVIVASLAPAVAGAQFEDLGKKAVDAAQHEGVKAARAEANDTVVHRLNAKLLAEGRKNQCSFKTDTDQLAPGCDAKARKLANVLIDAKKAISGAGLESWKFVVSGHTDSVGNPAHNQLLSEKRAAAIVRELVAKGVPAGDIEAVGMGATRPLVKRDDTEAKRARNRRYEVQIRL